MRTLGLLGGMSWESTLPYYRYVNERVREKLGGLHSAKLVLYSVDFAEIERLQHIGDWATAGRVAWWTASELTGPSGAWKDIKTKAGMPTVIPYALRHSSIVRGIKANLPIRLVAALHDTSVAMISRRP